MLSYKLQKHNFMTYHLKNIWKNKKKCPTKRASESTITHVSKLQGKQI